jgi:hypothetical protein
MPHQDNIRKYDGVIFLRRGIYRDGVFRFTLELPAEYNSNDQFPKVVFSPPIFHPLIHPKVRLLLGAMMPFIYLRVLIFVGIFCFFFLQTGVVDLRADTNMRGGWCADKHFLITVLVFVKRLFYLSSFDDFEEGDESDENFIVNEEALKL